ELFASVAPGLQEGGYVAEPSECEHFYAILAEALDNLSAYPRKGVAVSVWVLWHLLKLMGSAPDLDKCALCGVEYDLTSFSSTAGGTLCGHCASGRLEALEIRPEVFSLWKQFVSASLAESLQQRYLPAVYAEAEYLLWDHFYQNWHINLKSRRLLQIGERNIESFRH
ncbi:TPA: DNA repair protein RecO, partial [bacterium UBP9_UBA11836]|nr:DNA repair protein RecO [bacterium UBP9_UBA11836]